MPSPEEPKLLLEQFHGYLYALAQAKIDPQLQGKVDLSGIVQQTLLEAHQAWEKLQGMSERQRLGWLGACLSHNLTDEIRKLRTGQRNVSREQSLEQALEQSSVRLEAWLVAEQSSPSVQAMRHEKELRVAAALAVLPELQRSIVVLRYWHRWQLAQIAEHLGRTLGSVAGLLHRAEKQLGQLLQDLSGEE